MIAIREFLNVVDHQIIINLPDNFDYDEVEAVVMQKKNIIDKTHWNDKEIQNIGKTGFHSGSFEADDDEDYSKW